MFEFKKLSESFSVAATNYAPLYRQMGGNIIKVAWSRKGHRHINWVFFYGLGENFYYAYIIPTDKKLLARMFKYRPIGTGYSIFDLKRMPYNFYDEKGRKIGNAKFV